MEQRDANVNATAAVASFARAPQPADKVQILDTVIRHLIGALKAMEELREELRTNGRSPDGHRP